MRTVSVLFVVGAIAAAACQPMYRAKAQKMKAPDEVARPIEDGSGSAVAVVPKLDDNCGTERRTKAVKGTVSDLAQEGARKRIAASRESDGEKRARMAADAVEDYRAVLARDPYNQEATLGLAVSYDMLRRKGCAMKMLSRISMLAKHKPFEKGALQLADEVKSNPKWFEYYRADAERLLP